MALGISNEMKKREGWKLDKSGFVTPSPSKEGRCIGKNINLPNYPIQLECSNRDTQKSGTNLRPSTIREWSEDGFTKAAKKSFSRNAAKIWNQAPDTIKNAESLKFSKRPKNILQTITYLDLISGKVHAISCTCMHISFLSFTFIIHKSILLMRSE